MERAAVYKLVDGERDYQNERWGKEATGEDDTHSATEWLAYIDDYVQEARHICAREPSWAATPKAMHVLRKVAALAIAAMEEHGVEPRQGRDRHGHLVTFLGDGKVNP